jgi:hypothetical protein
MHTFLLLLLVIVPMGLLVAFPIILRLRAIRDNESARVMVRHQQQRANAMAGSSKASARYRSSFESFAWYEREARTLRSEAAANEALARAIRGAGHVH